MQTDLDFQLLFEESPDVLLVLLPDAPRFTMVAATKARWRATLHDPAERHLVQLGRTLAIGRADPPVHTPAAVARAVLAKEVFEGA